MGLFDWPGTPERQKMNRRRFAKFRWGYTLFAPFFIFLFLREWRRVNFTGAIFLPPLNWHRWFDDPRSSLLTCANMMLVGFWSWKTWWGIREEERLRKLRESHSVPTEGVWPPPPRRE